MVRRKASTPVATAARYDRKADRVILSLSTNLEIMFSPKNAQGLEHASPRSSKASSARANGWPPASAPREAKPAPPPKPPPPARTAPSEAVLVSP